MTTEQNTLVEIEINGQKLQAKPGAMIIQVADGAGMTIPRFCYHKKLSIAANCRMCLVEVSGARKPMPACATPITSGMKVFTQSPLAIDAQRSVMEFLLINHPLDCPICDQGGECELQDVSMGYGKDISRYNQGKRSVADKNIGPLIQTDMTRCIQCTRCVRFGEEIAGMKELGAVNRGEHMEITAYLEQGMESELSGNVIDLCPVGALTNKPYRYSARAWELTQYQTVSPHDAVGSHLFGHVINNMVKRIVPKDNEAINETWISDRDRYSCFGLYHEDRLSQPEIKMDGVWHKVDWDTALNAAVERLNKVINEKAGAQIGGLLSPSSTIEEAYLFQGLLRALGSQNIDHRLRQQDFLDDNCQPAYPRLTDGFSIANFSTVSAALVIGSVLRKEQPIINQRLRQAALAGAKIYFINPVPFTHNFPVAGERIDIDMVQELMAVASAVAEKTNSTLPSSWASLYKELKVTEAHKKIAAALMNQGEKAVVVLGTLALHHPQAGQLRALASFITQQTKAHGSHLTEGANSAGAWMAGAVPHRLAGGKKNKAGLNALEMIQQKLSAYILLGVEPEFDHADSAAALAALKEAECVVALTAFTTAHMREYADVLLPIGPFSETGGSFVNMEGKCQSFNGMVKPLGESRPAWKVLRVMANLFGLHGFDFVTSRDVLAEVQDHCESSEVKAEEYTSEVFKQKLNAEGLIRIAETPIYSIDSLVRRSAPLQETPDAAVKMIKLHPDTAAKMNIKEGDEVTVKQSGHFVKLPVILDKQLPKHAVWLPAAIEASMGLGMNYGTIEIEHV